MSLKIQGQHGDNQTQGWNHSTNWVAVIGIVTARGSHCQQITTFWDQMVILKSWSNSCRIIIACAWTTISNGTSDNIRSKSKGSCNDLDKANDLNILVNKFFLTYKTSIGIRCWIVESLLFRRRKAVVGKISSCTRNACQGASTGYRDAKRYKEKNFNHFCFQTKILSVNLFKVSKPA